MKLPAWIEALLRPGRQGVAVTPERGRVLLRATRFPFPLSPDAARSLARELEDAASEAERTERWT